MDPDIRAVCDGSLIRPGLQGGERERQRRGERGGEREGDQEQGREGGREAGNVSGFICFNYFSVCTLSCCLSEPLL